MIWCFQVVIFTVLDRSKVKKKLNLLSLQIPNLNKGLPQDCLYCYRKLLIRKMRGDYALDEIESSSGVIRLKCASWHFHFHVEKGFPLSC